MFAYELPLDPPCNDWEDDQKPRFINFVIEEMCRNILDKGRTGSFPDAFDYLYEYIEDNIEKYLPEQI